MFVVFFCDMTCEILRIHVQKAMKEKQPKDRNVLVNAYHRNNNKKSGNFPFNNNSNKILRRKKKNGNFPFNTIW